jgi:hypothetical protein
METKVLINALNNLYCDRAYDICRKTIITYSHSPDITTIQSKLQEWQSSGYLLILKPLVDCSDLEPSIRLLKLIPKNSE